MSVASYTGRKYSIANTNYRFGFNGKENDNDIESGAQDYGMRIYDGRLGRFLSVDPLTKKYPELTPYQFASNSPIWGVDRDGKEFQVNNWLWNIWMDWEFGDPTGIKTLKSGLEEKASIQSHQMSYNNEHVPEDVQNKLDIVHNIDANTKIAAGTSKLIAFNVKTSGEILINIVPIGKGAELIFRGGSETGIIDIALGLRNGEQLPEFANLVKAPHVDQWPELGLYNKNVTNFPDAFHQAVDKVLESGGKIKFDITKLDLSKAAKAQGKSLYDEGIGYTDWEFGQVTGNSKLLKSTEFYENGKLVKTSEVLKRAGIKK